jgi:phosphoglycerol transferase MdoB-like AlkP superfamily enzyme
MICCADMITICLILLQKKPQVVEGRAVLFIFSVASFAHGEFSPMTKNFEIHPLDSDCNKYVNTLHYSDYYIGHLIKKLKKKGGLTMRYLFLWQITLLE